MALLFAQGLLYRVGYDVDGHLVVASLRDDDVGVALARLDELEIHRLDRARVPLDHPVHVLSSFGDVARHHAHEPVVIVGVHEDFHVHLFAQLLAGENQDAFDYDYVGRFHGHGLGLRAGA